MIYEIHPIAEIFPRMSDTEFASLVADIKANGLLEPIWLYENKVIDGRHRYQACAEIGVHLLTRNYEGSDPVGFVVSLNLKRRHLNESQRAMVAASLANMPSHRPDDKSANLRTSQTDAATILQVSPRSVQTAVVVKNSGAKELIQAVQAGKVSVSAAADVATLPKEKQVEIVARGEREILEAAKAIRMEKAAVLKAERSALLDQQRKDIESGVAKLPDGVFEVVCIDPPWAYGREYDPDGSRVANPYPEMSQDELKALKVPFADDAVVFLWTTHQFIWEAKELLDHWGFTYKATLVWDKEKIGMGAWLRMQCEFCLVGIKGKPTWENTTWRDVIREPRREHSRKPETFYRMVEEITVGRRIDYFSREQRTGWASFGNDTGKF